jgi:hypothetical protein
MATWVQYKEYVFAVVETAFTTCKVHVCASNENTARSKLKALYPEKGKTFRPGDSRENSTGVNTDSSALHEILDLGPHWGHWE